MANTIQGGAAGRAFILPEVREFIARHKAIGKYNRAADFRHTSQHVKVATLRPQQAAIHAAQLPGTPPASGPGGVRHGRTSRPCNTVSTRRARGLANATELQDSQLCYRHTRPPLCLAAARQAAAARSRVRRARADVGSSQTCAHAAPMGAGKTQNSPQVQVTGGKG